MSEDRARAERLLSGDEDRPGIRPAVNFADHSYPAFSAKQMVDFALLFASEREAIGRAAGREEAAKVADDHATVCDAFVLASDEGACRTYMMGEATGARTVSRRIRALPVDGGKDGADG